MAVPMTVKMPEPITAPIPSAVRDHGPRVFLSECSGSSDSLMSLSIDLRANSWLGRAVLLKPPVAWILSPDFVRGFCPSQGSVTEYSASGWGGEVPERTVPVPVRNPVMHWWVCGLTLRVAARELLDLLLGRTARFCALPLGSGFLACSAFQFLPFQLVFYFGGVGHV